MEGGADHRRWQTDGLFDQPNATTQCIQCRSRITRRHAMDPWTGGPQSTSNTVGGMHHHPPSVHDMNRFRTTFLVSHFAFLRPTPRHSLLCAVPSFPSPPSCILYSASFATTAFHVICDPA